MRIIPHCTALAAALLMAGCVPSLSPLYTEKDLTFDPGLVGVWEPEDNSAETWAFEKAGDKAYKLVYTEKEKKGEFEAHLLKLGDTLFLDFFPNGEPLEQLDRNDFYKSHLLLAHTFAKVSQIEPKLQMALLNPDWLKKLLEKEPDAIAHRKLDEDRIVLTASTAELQKFITRHAKTKGAFGDEEPVKLRKVQPKSK